MTRTDNTCRRLHQVTFTRALLEQVWVQHAKTNLQDANGRRFLEFMQHGLTIQFRSLLLQVSFQTLFVDDLFDSGALRLKPSLSLIRDS